VSERRVVCDGNTRHSAWRLAAEQKQKEERL
jgi:hypothetical protein